MLLRELSPGEVGPRAEELIPLDAPTRPRALAVIDGVLSGRIWADDATSPQTLIVIEDADGTVYAGGALRREVLRDTLGEVETASRELIFGYSGSGDPLRKLVPAEPYWSGEAIDFTDRLPPDDEAEALDMPLADGARAVRLDASLLPRIEWYEDTLHAFGSAQRWMELAVGFAVMVGDTMAAEALAGPRCRGMLEMGVVTREAYRGRGYGTFVSRLTARACEERGDRVWWNANATNLPSLAIARRLGFRHERRYDLVACRAPLALDDGRTIRA